MPLVQTVVGQKQIHTLSSSRSKHQKTLKFRDVLFSVLVSMEKQSLLCHVMSSRLESVLHVCFQLEISVLSVQVALKSGLTLQCVWEMVFERQ